MDTSQEGMYILHEDIKPLVRAIEVSCHTLPMDTSQEGMYILHEDIKPLVRAIEVSCHT